MKTPRVKDTRVEPRRLAGQLAPAVNRRPASFERLGLMCFGKGSPPARPPRT